MSIEDIISKFNENLNFLRSKPGVTIHYCEIPNPVEEHCWERLEDLQINIPLQVRQFYEACNGLHLSWSFSSKEEGFTIYGIFEIVPIEYFIGGDSYEPEDIEEGEVFRDILYSDFSDETQIPLRKEMNVFEKIETDSAYICINTVADDSLWYVSDFAMNKIEGDLFKYLNLLIDTMGVDVFRQMHVQQNDFDHREFDYGIVEVMEKIFPWFNFTEIQEKYFGDDE